MANARWDALYLLPLASFLGIFAFRWNMIVDPLTFVHSWSLLALSTGLLLYFWHWDTESPGFRTTYPCKSFLVQICGVGVMFSFVILFVLVANSAVYFPLGISVVYFVKTMLNASFTKHITNKKDTELNHLAVYSDTISTVVFAAYSIFAMWLVQDKNSPIFLDTIVAVSFLTIIGIEWYYQIVAKIIGNIVEVYTTQPPTSSPSPSSAPPIAKMMLIVQQRCFLNQS